MAKIIDTFLLFQELDLLEIRLEYLYPVVDYFIIVEADMTFSGKRKPYNYEENSNRFARFKDKIIYFKITGEIGSWIQINSYLTNFSKSGRIIQKLLDNHTHYDKNKMHWVLESFHRECIRIPLSEIADDDDIILLSDLDEIPNYKFLENFPSVENNFLEILSHHEFRYKFNLYYPKLWKGTIISCWATLKSWSFNVLRQEAQSGELTLEQRASTPVGYHFTSVGSFAEIKSKIEAWGHQEFNNSLVKMNLKKNIESGSDIFARKGNLSLEIVDLKENIYDSRMRELLMRYPHLIQTTEFTTKSRFWNLLTNYYSKLTKFIKRR